MTRDKWRALCAKSKAPRGRYVFVSKRFYRDGKALVAMPGLTYRKGTNG